MQATVESTNRISFDQACDYIRKLDLNYIAESMCAEQYPLPRWIMSDALLCLQQYKNFLILAKKHFPKFLVPTKYIDEFWHNHILYTKNYFEDCKNIFGHYLHHEPTSPSEDPAKLIDGYLMTKQLYLEEFNQPLELVI
jgi:hypothetical protein